MGCFFAALLFFNQSKINSKPVHIAVIYAERIKKEALSYQKFEKKFEQERENIRLEFQEKEKLLREEFLQNKKKKNKKNYQNQKEKLLEKAKELENDLQNKKEEFSKKMQSIVKALEDSLNQAIEDTVKKNNFNMVLNKELNEKTLVLYSDKGFDITDEIIERLNKINMPVGLE